MPVAPQHDPSHPWRGSRRSHQATARSGFSLLEWLVTLSILVIMLAVGSVSLRALQERGVLAQAKNAVVTYAAVARNYAVANHIETMLLVNPYNGRFEIWHLNPPREGGIWDPRSSGDLSDPAMADGYAYAPVLDGSAALPRRSDGRPTAAVHPIDYDDPTYRPTSPDANERNLDNLTWAAFCFDENGKLVIRTRRVATRSYRFRSGSLRPAAERNRLDDESPDLALRLTAPLVDVRDTPITSTRGFVISDVSKMKLAPGVGVNPTADDLVNRWLVETRLGGRYAGFAETVVLDRFSGQELVGDL